MTLVRGMRGKAIGFRPIPSVLQVSGDQGAGLGAFWFQLFGENCVEESERGDTRNQQDKAVPCVDADTDSPEKFFGTEEHVDGVLSSIIALLGLGFGNEVGDLLVGVAALGTDFVAARCEAGFLEGGAGDEFVYSADSAVEIASRAAGEAAEDREGVFEVLEAILFLFCPVFLFGELLDEILDFFLAAGEGIEFCLCDDKGLVAVVGGDEF